MNWNQFKKGIFLVNVLAIIYKNGKILIGKRKPDPYIKQLKWSFPGGRLHYGKTIESSLKVEVKKKTNLKIKIHKLVFARTFGTIKIEFLNLYYFCTPLGSINNARAGEKFTEIMWIKPSHVTKYFKPPAHPFVLKFLKKLEKSI